MVARTGTSDLEESRVLVSERLGEMEELLGFAH